MTRFLFLLDFYILSHDAWGALRNPATHAVLTTAQNLELNRGYCGHEHLTNFGIINMNARLYDPYLGRFLSPDPYVQEPNNTQSLNRYTYCLNNPLKYTDPSGEIFLEALFGFARGIVELCKGGKWYDPFKYAWINLKTEGKLIAGLFKGSFRQIESRFTWEAPQTFLGFFFSKYRALFLNTFGHGAIIGYHKGATFVIGPGDKGITLGSYINIWTGYYNNETGKYEGIRDDKSIYMHEYGHYRQSQMFGPFYLSVFGIPSLLSAATSKKNGSHKTFYTEIYANNLAYRFFKYKTHLEWYKDTGTSAPLDSSFY